VAIQSRKDFTVLIRQLLTPYDLWEQGAGHYRSCCPVHGGANKSSFVIDSVGRWRCHSCKAWGDLTKLVSILTGISLKQAKETIGNAPDRLMTELPTLSTWEEHRKGKGPNYSVLSEATLGPYRRYCPGYLVARDFSELVLKEYEIGYDNHNCRIVIPARDAEGRLVGLTYRTDFDIPGRPKYWHDQWDKSAHLWGLHKHAGKLVENFFLVEGQLDAVRLSQLGQPAAAIMGSSISSMQISVLVRNVRCKRLVLMFDNDEAGVSATKQVLKALSKTRFSKSTYIASYEAKDPGELRRMKGVVIRHWTKALLPSSDKPPILKLPALLAHTKQPSMG